jgi:hypothetical protein
MNPALGRLMEQSFRELCRKLYRKLVSDSAKLAAKLAIKVLGKQQLPGSTLNSR